ncbi:hypothetical protein GP664_23355 [Escherichia coli]|uniref:hypothetical protein n=1 Tax=Escherichia coli TaxID=562 RepID=UPI0012FD0576|nr:hypothetical protein [Escherichia coli]EFM6596142.1 hypothetical protein [Escherichia coli]MVW21380.1 hypothetical protein [Escherichia coli]
MPRTAAKWALVAILVPFFLVEMRISDEWGEVKARAQYLIHYKAADGRATTEWFGESMLEATEDDRHPGCPVFAGMELPEGAVVTE